MRRLLATPTFLAGACCVIAATLAYGTTQTHLLYSEPGCQAAHCSAPGPKGNANRNSGTTLKTSARPGVGGEHGPAHGGGQVHQPQGVPSPPGSGTPPSHHAAHPASQSPPQPPSPPVTVGGGQPGPRVAVLYHTLKTWHGGFLAAITIANHGTSALDGWQLWLQYRVTEIDHVWGAHWFPYSAKVRNAGLVAAPASQPKVKPGAVERFTFRATGTPGAPAGCSFDGYRCTVKTVAGRGGHPGGGGKGRKPGGRH
jgi:hypothetical protein